MFANNKIGRVKTVCQTSQHLTELAAEQWIQLLKVRSFTGAADGYSTSTFQGIDQASFMSVCNSVPSRLCAHRICCCHYSQKTVSYHGIYLDYMGVSLICLRSNVECCCCCLTGVFSAAWLHGIIGSRSVRMLLTDVIPAGQKTDKDIC